MKIAHLAKIDDQVFTGPRNSVTLLAKHLNSLTGVQADVFTSPHVAAFKFNDTDVNPLLNMNALQKYDCVVFSSFFNMHHIRVASFLKKHDIPYVVSPRSSLVRSAFERSALKKYLFMAFCGYRYLKNARAVHFLTEDERHNSFKSYSDYFVSPNISSFSPPDSSPVSSNKTTLVGFMGRYDLIHKGLDKLASAIANEAEFYRARNIRFVIAGPDFRGGRLKLKNLINDLKISDLIELRGPVTGTKKLEFLSSCCAFIHTSRFEGQPQAVVEAMALGLPVLVTPGTNMQSIVKAWECGVCLRDDEADLAEDLKAALTSLDKLAALSTKSRECALTCFSPHVVATMFSSAIKRVLTESN